MGPIIQICNKNIGLKIKKKITNIVKKKYEDKETLFKIGEQIFKLPENHNYHRKTNRLFDERLNEMHEKYVEPIKKFCDIIIDSQKKVDLKKLIKVLNEEVNE